MDAGVLLHGLDPAVSRAKMLCYDTLAVKSHRVDEKVRELESKLAGVTSTRNRETRKVELAQCKRDVVSHFDFLQDVCAYHIVKGYNDTVAPSAAIPDAIDRRLAIAAGCRNAEHGNRPLILPLQRLQQVASGRSCTVQRRVSGQRAACSESTAYAFTDRALDIACNTSCGLRSAHRLLQSGERATCRRLALA